MADLFEFETSSPKDLKRQKWQKEFSFKWMLAPVPVWDEESEGVVMMPLSESLEEVEAIRECAREWEAGDKRRKLPSYLFDNLSDMNMDWDNIVRRENFLEMEFVDGMLFEDKKEPYNL